MFQPSVPSLEILPKADYELVDNIGQMPYLVSIKVTRIKLQNVSEDGRALYVWDNLCGGSIIQRSKVLTAAHCFEFNNFFAVKHTSALRVVAGSLQSEAVHTGDTVTTANMQWRGVQRLRLHEHFNFPLNDIALIIVDMPFRFNANVSSIRYTKRVIDYPEICKSGGYGDLSFNPDLRLRSSVLMVALIKTMPRWQCSGIWEMDMNTYICSESVISDVAQGDSGGPLACTGTLDPSEVHGQDILLGIVSGKSIDRTTLFTRVSSYTDWIESSSGSKLMSNFMFLLLMQWIFQIYTILLWFRDFYELLQILHASDIP
ncbi:chymotrypsin-like elastase family member 2A [Cydia fagiglandana]|uniref:chymotrypsin-like elastase family member 2A n=1 Tax=Cydia fagiglandana TaxID=1458189 RepID=UPI002FEE12E2